MKRTHFFAAAAAALLLSAVGPVIAGPTDFETPEYNSSTGLRSLNASEAYALGFTGKGVTVGVVDAYFCPPLGEFDGKYLGGYLGTKADNHGTHVAGIIAARRDGIGMHGAAFDAGLFPVATFGDDDFDSEDAWKMMGDIPGLRVISNSWGTYVYPDQSRDFDTGEKYSTFYYGADGTDANYLKNWLHGEENSLARTALELAREDKLFVFAGGNEGHLSPSGDAALPPLVEKYGIDSSDSDARAARDLKLHWINVAAFDPRYVQPDGHGAWIPNGPAFPAIFTNMGLYATDYTLWAPGVGIYSTFGARQYGYENGTSMSTPYVSGVAALVQSAFPYMGGKQIADVLLSTATKFDDNNTPAVFVLYREEKATANADPVSRLQLYYDENRRSSIDDITDEDKTGLINAIQWYLKNLTNLEDDPVDVLEDIINSGQAIDLNP